MAMSVSGVRMREVSRLVGTWGLLLLLLWGELRFAEAGCQRFGHSCFGAHGKRADVPGVGGGVGDVPELVPNVPADVFSSPQNYRNFMDLLMSGSQHRAIPLPYLNYLNQRYSQGGADELGEIQRK